ncbi:MAG: ATP synthase F1 subunit delta [Bacteroidales bacterium]|nr:ATP synthase F1 subunit delta [Bacteroidales bacterium]
MNNSKISVRYAKALFQTAVEKNIETEVRGDVASLLECIKSSEDFRALLESPVIAPDNKIKIFDAMFGGKFQKLTSDFFAMTVKNKREGFLKIICLNYLGFYAKGKNIRKVVITSAAKLDGESASQIEMLVKKQDENSTVELSEQVDENILGGLIIQIDDKVYDASIRTQLKKVKEKLK